MSCRRIRDTVLKDADLRSTAVQEHLRTCGSCTDYLQQWETLRTGLRRLAEQPAPEPSLGFAQRVVRSLQDPIVATRLLDLPLVRAGRRFVYAALMTALLLALGLLLPASGPVRSPSAVVEVAQPETVAAQNYPIFSGRLMDNDFEFAPPAGSH
jgi:anti-sigma factor RsiW